MNAYSYWEQGRDLGSGQIVSMTPFSPSNGGSVLGTVPLGGAGMALSAVAQFGIYCEIRRMNQLKEAEFEERRNGWINHIASQWIEEHKHISGIRRDVTLAVSRECQKMWENLCKNEMVDVPQTVLLQISRMTEFLEWNYFLAASASNNLVEASGSSDKWILNSSLKSKAIVDETLEEALNESKGEWWKGLLKTLGGIPLLLVPGVGPFAGGGAIGYGVAEMFQCLRVKKSDLEDLDDKI